MSKHGTELFAGLQPPLVGERTPFCPDDLVMAAWFEHGLQSAEAERVGRHLADCGYCRSRMGVLGRLAEPGHGETVSEELLVRAKQAARVSRMRRRVSPPAMLAAAVLVLALGVVLTGLWQPHRQFPAEGERTLRQPRSAEHVSFRPEILQPAANANLMPGSLVVQWTPVEGSLYYELLVMDDTGQLLLSERSQETKWRSTAALRLRPGSAYYLRVNAFLADGRKAGSEHRAFSVGPDEPGPKRNDP